MFLNLGHPFLFKAKWPELKVRFLISGKERKFVTNLSPGVVKC